jgi:hypothetical protein
MVTVDRTELLRAEPADIVDRLLWQDAQQMLGRHAEADRVGSCVWCGWRFPCAARRVAERADAAARRPWQEALTLRHDLNSIRAMPGMIDNAGRTAGRPSWQRRVARNRGAFD